MIPAGFYNLARVATLLVFGYATINIFHFYIEDLFDLPILRPLIMGRDYASPLSYAIVCFSVLIVLEFFEKRLIYAPDETKIIEMRQRWDGRIMGICLIVAGLICGAVLYRYLSGITDERGLYRIIITLGVLLSGGFYSYVNILRCRKEFHIFGGGIVLVSLVIGILSCATVALKAAPPREMALLRKDIKSFEQVKDVARLVGSRRHAKGELIKNQEAFKATVALGARADGYGDSLQYTRVNSDQFKLCTTFKSEAHKQVRRISSMASNDRHFIKRGEFCATYKYDPSRNRNAKVYLITHHHGDDHDH